jgi:ABC-type glycerol-3-phosphate transport system substrate-binding protein
MKKQFLLVVALLMVLVVSPAWAQRPVEIEYWNINTETFGGPAVAQLIDKFNETIGKEKNIVVVNRFITDGYGGKSTLFRTFLKRHQLKIALGTGSTILTG